MIDEKPHERKAWLESLKEGDTVILTGGPTHTSLGHGVLAKITRLTKTLFILDVFGGVRIRRADGNQQGAHYYGYHIVEATPERVNEIRENRRREKAFVFLRSYRYSKLPTEVLELLVNTIKRAQGNSDAG